MENYTREQLSKMLETSYATPREGDIIKAQIVKRTQNGVLLSLGLKAEGFLPLEEFSVPDDAVEGKFLYVYLEAFEDRDGFPVISKKKADFQLAWEKIKRLYENGDVSTVVVRKRIKGGYTVDLMGVDAFLPSSQVEMKSQSDPDSVIGQTFNVKIVKINMMRKNIVVSRRLALEEEQSKNRKKVFSKFRINDIVEGTVRNITDYGAFIDIGGVDGLLHISDMAWEKVTHPAEIVKSGDRIKIKILSMDKNTGRIAVGLKQLTPHPWEAVENQFPIGMKIHGKVTNVVENGAFVEIEKGIEGFVPISEMSWSKDDAEAAAILKVDDIVEAVVLSVDRDDRRIFLGMKQAQPDPWSVVEEKYSIGQKIQVKVTNLKNFGAFVRLPDGIEGLVHVNDFFWDKKVTKASDYLKKGQRIEAVIRSVDRKNRKISLSIKHTKEDPFQHFVESYVEGTKIMGKVSDILPKGIRLKLDNGLEEFIPSPYLARQGKKLKDMYKLDEDIEVTIKKINPKIRRIILTEKEAARTSERRSRDEARQPAGEKYDKFTLGDIIGAGKIERPEQEEASELKSQADNETEGDEPKA